MDHVDGNRDARDDPGMSGVETAVVAVVVALAAGLLSSAVALGIVYSQTQVIHAGLAGGVVLFGAGVVVAVVAGTRVLARHYGRPARPVHAVGRAGGERSE